MNPGLLLLVILLLSVGSWVLLVVLYLNGFNVRIIL